jgi:hypothetical protein
MAGADEAEQYSIDGFRNRIALGRLMKKKKGESVLFLRGK